MIDEILKEKIFPRDFYTSRITAYLWSPVIKVLIWQRRVGKSYILKSIIKDLVESEKIEKQNVWYINKELPIFDHIKIYDDLKIEFDLFKKGKKGRIFVGIDEIQEIEWWEKFVNGLLATYGDTIEIFITGSNSFLLSSELVTYISGRYMEFPVHALSYEEFSMFKNEQKTKELFLDYLKYGWLPGIFRMQWSDETIFGYLRWVYNTIVLKDIIRHHSIKNTVFLEELYKYTLSNIGNIFSAKSISDFLKSQKIKISVDSVINFLGYAEQTFLLNKTHSVDPETKKYFEIYNKYYISDLWLRNSLVGYHPSKDIWKLLENYVFLALKRHDFTIKIGRLKTNKEIDFIAEKSGKTLYFQVCTTILDETTRAREYTPLYEIRDNWPKYVVSFDEIDFWENEGIQHLNIMKLEELLGEK